MRRQNFPVPKLLCNTITVSATSKYPNLLTRLWRYAVLFLRRPDDIAFLAPSSRFLTRKLAGLPCVKEANTIVELGPGDGGITRDLLDEMQSGARLLAIELLADMVEVLHSIRDKRLIIEHDDASELAQLIDRHGLGTVDVIVSGIPFSVLDEQRAAVIVEAVFQSLRPGGTFVAYQVRDEVNGLALGRFGKPETAFVPWNLPPVHLYQWRKPQKPMSPCVSDT